MLTNSATKLVVSVSSTGSELVLSVTKKEEASVLLTYVASTRFIHFLDITTTTKEMHRKATSSIQRAFCGMWVWHGLGVIVGTKIW